MPYTIRREDGKYCVYKVNGGKVACHDTRKQAGRQIAAIEANEGKAALARAYNLRQFDADRIDGHDFYIASNDRQRKEGLAGLSTLDKAGMLFEYDDDVTHPFTMANMEFDLDIGFYDAEGRLIASKTSPSHSTEPVRSPQPYRYVVEVPSGTVDLTKLDVTARWKKRKKKKG